MDFITKGSNGKVDEDITGARRDNQDDKLRYDLISVHGLRRLAGLYTRGAKKYSERNWEQGQRTSRTLASLWRHLMAFQMGMTDEDHASAVVFNMFSIIHVQEEIAAGRLPAELNDIVYSGAENKVIQIELTQDQVTVIDEIDADLAEYNWYANEDTRSKRYYAHRAEGQKTIRLHNVIGERMFGAFWEEGKEIDHIDRNGLNNTRANLRLATQQQQARNSLRVNSTGYRGVVEHCGKWQSQIRANGKQIHLGTFETPEDAAKAYDVAAIEHHGEFAVLNFPPT